MRRVLITAAASGIGRSIAEAFVEAGDRVHVADTDEDELASLPKLRGVGTTVADVADPDAVDQLFAETAETLGGLDVLVNNAGIAGPTAPVEAIEPEKDAGQRIVVHALQIGLPFGLHGIEGGPRL